MKEQLKTLCRKYIDIFRKQISSEPAKVSPMVLQGDLPNWQVPQNTGSYRSQSNVREDEIRTLIEKLLKNKVIRVSQQPYYSQLHLVKKPDGSWRICIDYRKLNKILKSMGWPLPNIKQMLWRLGKSKAK